MKLLNRYHADGNTHDFVAIFGLGLIGKAICHYINMVDDYSVKNIPFSWNDISQTQKDQNNVFDHIVKLKETLERTKNRKCRYRIAIVWSAGKAGFSATEQEAESELNSFKIVLELAERLKNTFPSAMIFFHYVSSAGGLFEGCSSIGKSTAPKPIRNYGKLKKQQEDALLRGGAGLLKKIYRPTSVYGYLGGRYRMGLIPTLLKNGMQNKVSKIYGSYATLRDYVLNLDVGKFIGDHLFSNDNNKKPEFYFIASGKPSSIFEVKKIVENQLRKRIFVQFIDSEKLKNSKSIILQSHLLPREFFCTDLRNGVRAIKEKIISQSKSQSISW